MSEHERQFANAERKNTGRGECPSDWSRTTKEHLGGSASSQCKHHSPVLSSFPSYSSTSFPFFFLVHALLIVPSHSFIHSYSIKSLEYVCDWKTATGLTATEVMLQLWTEQESLRASASTRNRASTCLLQKTSPTHLERMIKPK